MMSLCRYHDIMIRTQIQFEKETYQALQAAVKHSKESISELVRQSVKRYLQENKTTAAWKRSLAAAGQFHSGLKDIAVNHDHYLSDEW